MFFVDSGATSHMVRDRALYTEYHTFEKPTPVTLGDGKPIEAIGTGTVWVQSEVAGKN